MYTNLHKNYLESEIMSAGPVKLVELLYRGAIDSVAAARGSLQNGDIMGRSRKISKAVAILNELARSLDHSKAEDLSRRLAELYDYMARRLNDANFQQTEAPLIEVNGLLNVLIEAWQQCADGEHGALSVPSYAGAPDYEPISCSF
jgi:flagellar secretion chaperone FliS